MTQVLLYYNAVHHKTKHNRCFSINTVTTITTGSSFSWNYHQVILWSNSAWLCVTCVILLVPYYFVVPLKCISFVWTVGIPTTSGSSSGLCWQSWDHGSFIWSLPDSSNCHSDWCQSMSTIVVKLWIHILISGLLQKKIITLVSQNEFVFLKKRHHMFSSRKGNYDFC